MKDLSIKIKLWILVIVSIVAILVMSIDKITSGLAVKNNIQTTKNRILEAESLASTVHYLQIERGLSVGFLVSGGTKNSNEIDAIRKKVNSAIDEIKRVYSITHGDSSILSSLSELEKQRTLIDSFLIEPSAAAAYYIKGIKSLLDTTLLIPPLIDDKDGRNIIQAYTHLASSKEQLGQIRANLNGAFTKNTFDENEFFELGGSLGAYHINLAKFKVLSSDNMQKFYESTYKGESVEKTVAMMNLAKEKGMHGNFGIEPSVWFSHATTAINLLREIEIALYKDVYNLADEKIKEANNSLLLIILVSASIIVALFTTAYFVVKNIANNINIFQQGLLSFFSFLNRETTKAQLIYLNSNDELGEMAKIINENISKTEAQIVMDNKLVEDANNVISRVENGWYSQHIVASTTNKSLEEFKNSINRMLDKTKDRFITINSVLETYAKNDFTKELELKGIEQKGVLEILVNDINGLRSTITQMLSNSLQNGLELQNEAGTLKQAVESLSTASNQQAASLEETAAAMEEMTSNVQNNVAKSNDMALMATQTDSAAKDGAVLASRTASAMTEIQSATYSINDAVAIIENIAFQ
ncbi:methyl-accepting chemotaxis protein, partial [Sulfurimonas sp.]|uniref:methyl-accepting chemotaxis protein n=1 Tax=Sulfurimonas sp. TaxID=2022749 RepID=UPI002609A129